MKLWIDCLNPRWHRPGPARDKPALNVTKPALHHVVLIRKVHWQVGVVKAESLVPGAIDERRGFVLLMRHGAEGFIHGAVDFF